MQHLASIFFIIFCVSSLNCFSQTWDLRKCNPDSILYPFENGRGSKKFPEGSCPPPQNIIQCFNNSKIKPVLATSQSHETYYTHTPELAIDDHMVTRWSAGDYVDKQWFQVDLGEVKAFRRIYLTWELAHAVSYEIQISDDGIKWETVATVANGDGFVDQVDVDVKGRYVRMQSLKKANEYGVSLFDFTICAEVE
jgi:hypothetical protein